MISFFLSFLLHCIDASRRYSNDTYTCYAAGVHTMFPYTYTYAYNTYFALHYICICTHTRCVIPETRIGRPYASFERVQHGMMRYEMAWHDMTWYRIDTRSRGYLGWSCTGLSWLGWKAKTIDAIFLFFIVFTAAYSAVIGSVIYLLPRVCFAVYISM